MFTVEYCASRAVPNVSLSEYLNTIGSKLLPGVDILWTGKLSLSCVLRDEQYIHTFPWIIQLEVIAFIAVPFRSKGNFQAHQCSVCRGAHGGFEATSCTMGQHPRQRL